MHSSVQAVLLEDNGHHSNMVSKVSTSRTLLVLLIGLGIVLSTSSKLKYETSYIKTQLNMSLLCQFLKEENENPSHILQIDLQLKKNSIEI